MTCNNVIFEDITLKGTLIIDNLISGQSLKTCKDYCDAIPDCKAFYYNHDIKECNFLSHDQHFCQVSLGEVR